MLKIITISSQQKKSTFSAAAVFVGAFAVLFSMFGFAPAPGAFGITTPLVSFAILLNRLFALSEAAHSYQYIHFAVPVMPEEYVNYIFVALVCVAVLLAGYVLVMWQYGSKIMCVALFLLFVTLQIYFGVFATPVWNIALAVAVVQYFIWQRIPRKGSNIVVFAAAVATVVLAVFIVYPGESPALSQISETIRDQFGRQLERPVTADTTEHDLPDAAQHQQHEMRPETAAEGNDPSGADFDIDRDDVFAGSRIGTAVGQRIWVLWLIAIAFAVGYAVWLARRVVAAYRRRRVFGSVDYAAAIDGMFRHAVQWLMSFGLVDAATTFVGCTAQLPGEHASKYHDAVNLWQEAMYGSRAMTAHDRQAMHMYLNETCNKLGKTVNPIKRVWMQVRLYLYDEGGSNEN